MKLADIETVRSDGQRHRMSAEEWKARQELACAYRLFDHLGWHSLIFNHITVRLPNEPNHFLINPFGLMYREVTASNLVKVDLAGNIVDGNTYPVNRAGFVIHSAIHLSRRGDAHAVMHTHTNAGVSVACQRQGLLPLSMEGVAFQGEVAYHDFEGISLDTGERERLIENLGDKYAMILRNHGLLTCGPTLADAFFTMFRLECACSSQIGAQSGGADLNLVGKSLQAKTSQQMKNAAGHGNTGQMLFEAMSRWMVDKDPGFLH